MPYEVGGGTAQEFYDRFLRNYNRNAQRNTPEQQFTQPGVNLGTLLGASNQLNFQGFSNLGQILQSQGRTDPAAFNRQVADIQRGTQGQQQSIQQQGSQANLQGSGVLQALQAATGQAGEDRVAGAYANEAALAEDRKRSDLEILRQLFINPSIDMTALGLGQYNQDRNRSDQEDAANQQAIAGLVGAIVAALCWVAREVYGPADPRWLFFRHYVVYDSPSWFFRLYARYGERFAEWLQTAPVVKPLIKPLFDRMVKRVFKEACDAR